MEGDAGIEVDIGLASLDEEKVDILRSHDDLAVPLPLNSKIEFAWVVEGREFSVKTPCRQSCSCGALISDVETVVNLPLSSRLDEDSGLPAEFRFRSLVVGAEAG